ncbi:hypothetical protein BB561_000474 [Smittium simulii]|uniref:DUF1308 domain-containing protein n=1 Tax=Smittium simulii TaxID=133385 RepID=A0A2T9YZ01_9FUNG|nr:hypothetical protein BB561_000474 [Smittium simulii]
MSHNEASVVSITNTCDNLIKILSAWESSLEYNQIIYPYKKQLIQVGLKKLSKLILAELTFYTKSESTNTKSSNLSYFKALHDSILQAKNILGILETLTWISYTERTTGKPLKLKNTVSIDIISENGSQWAKVINKTISSYWKYLPALELEALGLDITSDVALFNNSDRKHDFGISMFDCNSENSLIFESLKSKVNLIKTKNGIVWDVSDQAILSLPFFKNISLFNEASKNFLVDFKPPTIKFIFKNENLDQYTDIYKQYTNTLLAKILKLLSVHKIEMCTFTDKYDDFYNQKNNSQPNKIPLPNWSFDSSHLNYIFNTNIDTLNPQHKQTEKSISQESSIKVYSENTSKSNSRHNEDQFSYLMGTIMLDITTVCALISTTSHSKAHLNPNEIFYTKWLELQQADEENCPILDLFSKMFFNRNLVTTQSVFDRLHKTVSEVGGKNEYARFISLFKKNTKIDECLPSEIMSASFQGAKQSSSIDELWKSWLVLPNSANKIPHITIIESVPSDRFIRLYNIINNIEESQIKFGKKNFSKLNLDVFGTSDKLKIFVTTANIGLCGLISRSGIHGIPIQNHGARSLSEPRIYSNLIKKD